MAVTEEGGVAWSGGHVGQAAEEERDQRELTEIAGGCLKKPTEQELIYAVFVLQRLTDQLRNTR